MSPKWLSKPAVWSLTNFSSLSHNLIFWQNGDLYFCRSEREVLGVQLLFFWNEFFAFSCLHSSQVWWRCGAGLRKAEKGKEKKDLLKWWEGRDCNYIQICTIRSPRGQQQCQSVIREMQWVLEIDAKRVKAGVMSTIRDASWRLSDDFTWPYRDLFSPHIQGHFDTCTGEAWKQTITSN